VRAEGVPLIEGGRQVLEKRLEQRARLAGEVRALLVGRDGRRRLRRAVGELVRGLGNDAGVKLSARRAGTLVFEYGRILCWNFYVGGQLSIACPVRVVEDTDRGLMLWLADGSAVWRAVVPEATHLRDLDAEARPAEGFPVAPDRWRLGNSLIFQPAGSCQATWWLFDSDLVFQGWYVNLEYRTRGESHLDVADLELDLRVSPTRVCQWKDEASFEARIGQDRYWTAREADNIRAEGLAARRVAEARQFPFDGSYCDFTPDPSWDPPPRAAEPTSVLLSRRASPSGTLQHACGTPATGSLPSEYW
jgi:hypothetical protein